VSTGEVLSSLVSIDGSTLDVADTEANLAHFGRQESSRGQSAFPQLRFVALCENWPHAIFGVRISGYPIRRARGPTKRRAPREIHRKATKCAVFGLNLTRMPQGAPASASGRVGAAAPCRAGCGNGTPRHAGAATAPPGWAACRALRAW
jgi:hypothetical protein